MACVSGLVSDTRAPVRQSSGRDGLTQLSLLHSSSTHVAHYQSGLANLADSNLPWACRRYSKIDSSPQGSDDFVMHGSRTLRGSELVQAAKDTDRLNDLCVGEEENKSFHED